MRVLHVIPSIAASDGGPSVVALETARHLSARGHDVIIATTDGNDAPTPMDRVGEVGEVSGARVMAFSRWAGRSFKWSPPHRRWVRAHVSDFDIVDIHAVFSYTSLSTSAEARRAGVPYVVRPHGALDPWSLGHHRGRKRALLALGARYFLSHAAEIQYTTETERRLAEQAMPGLPRGSVVPIGIDDSWFESGLSISRPTGLRVMTAGRLHPKKNLEVIIDACHEINAMTLTIVGAGDAAYTETLRARARGGPGAARITFTGWLAPEAQRTIMAQSTLFAMPSKQENFGLSAVEAMATGLPAMVAPGVNLADGIAAHNAGWVVEATADAWQSALCRVAASATRIREVGGAAGQFARQFRWSACIDALEAHYTSVLRARGPR